MLIELEKVAPFPLPTKIVQESEIWGADISFPPKSASLLSAQSGMGKSTLLHLIYGLRKDFSGKVLINGQDTRDIPHQNWENVRKTSISMVFQDLRLFPHLSARDNILLIPTQNETIPAMEEMADRLGMSPFLDHKVSTLSHGQRQRIAIIRALSKPFQLLLLDEPFSHLDEANQLQASLLIQEITERNGASMILSSLGTTPPLNFDHQYSL
jgi:putative ABC transport system ATP-binding protein